MPQYNNYKMCGKCPFRAGSLPGWLGPYTSKEIDKFIRNDGNFICHSEISRLTKKGYTKDEIELDGEHCVGALRYLNSICKLSRDPSKAIAQRILKNHKDQPTIPANKFTEYHSKFKPSGE